MSYAPSPSERILPPLVRDKCQAQPRQEAYDACIQAAVREDGKRRLLQYGAVLGGVALFVRLRGWQKMFGVALLSFGLMRTSLDADLRRAA